MRPPGDSVNSSGNASVRVTGPNAYSPGRALLPPSSRPALTGAHRPSTNAKRARPEEIVYSRNKYERQRPAQARTYTEVTLDFWQ